MLRRRVSPRWINRKRPSCFRSFKVRDESILAKTSAVRQLASSTELANRRGELANRRADVAKESGSSSFASVRTWRVHDKYNTTAGRSKNAMVRQYKCNLERKTTTQHAQFFDHFYFPPPPCFVRCRCVSM